jgi:hypothetical protein
VRIHAARHPGRVFELRATGRPSSSALAECWARWRRSTGSIRRQVGESVTCTFPDSSGLSLGFRDSTAETISEVTADGSDHADSRSGESECDIIKRRAEGSPACIDRDQNASPSE